MGKHYSRPEITVIELHFESFLQTASAKVNVNESASDENLSNAHRGGGIWGDDSSLFDD